MIRMRNLLLDVFTHGVVVPSIDFINQFSTAISFSAADCKQIYFRLYKINIATDKNNVSLQEVGPSCCLKIRRHKLANEEQFA